MMVVTSLLEKLYVLGHTGRCLLMFGFHCHLRQYFTVTVLILLNPPVLRKEALFTVDSPYLEVEGTPESL